MWRIWTVEIEGKKYEVEARYGPKWVNNGRGEVLVDSQVVDSWVSSPLGLPKERTFEVVGRKAVLRRVGITNQNMELYVMMAGVCRIK